MSTGGHTEQTEQRVLNDAKDANYQTIDVTPFIETAPGVSKPLGYQAPFPVSSPLVPASYDYIFLGYTGSNLTSVVFKTGGSGGTTVATLTLAYTGSRLDSVTKT